MSADPRSPTLHARGRQPLRWYGLAVLLLFGVYFETFAAMADIWWNIGTYTHGLLIIPISLYLVWERRTQILSVDPRPYAPGLLLVLGSSLFWLVSSIAGIQLFMQIAFFALWIGLTLTILGREVFRLCLFPLLYLFFAVPIGEQLVPPMMDLTASFTVMALGLTDIPFYYEGRFITLPTGNWEVAEACSGVRYIIASVALGLLYAFWSYQKLWKRLVFIGFSIAVPVLANGLRAVGIVLLGHYSGMTIAVGVDHLIYGWLFFGLVMFLLFWAGSHWRDERAAFDGPVKPETGELKPAQTLTATRNLPALAIGLALSGALAGAYLTSQLEHSRYQSRFPEGTAGWTGPDATTTNWNPIFPGAALVERRTYHQAAEQATVYLVHYGVQQQGRELINQTNHLFDRKIWRVLTGSADAFGLTPHPPFLKVIYKSGDRYRVLAWAYDIQGQRTTHELKGKWLEVQARLMGDTAGSTLVGFSADSTDGLAAADRILEQFLAQNPVVTHPGALVAVSGKDR